MSSVVTLPQGSLGLELEPVITGGDGLGSARSVGCRVKGWKPDSAVPQCIRDMLPPGTIITGVDGKVVEKTSFSLVVSCISSSQIRQLAVTAPPTSPPAVANAAGIETATQDSVDESPTDYEIKETPVVEAPVDDAPVDEAPVDDAPVDDAPVVEVAMQRESSEISPYVFEKAAATTAMSLQQQQQQEAQKKAGRCRDGKLLLLSGRVQNQQVDLQKAKSLITQLRSDLDMKENLLQEMKGSIGDLKKKNRNKDGKITLLCFQLDKSRQQQDELALDVSAATESQSVQNEQRSSIASSASFLEEQILLHSRKWNRVMSSVSALGEDQRAGEAIETLSEEGRDTEQLRRELMVQRRLNERLEAQMTAWVKEQINFQKQLASEDVDNMLKSQLEWTRKLPVEAPGMKTSPQCSSGDLSASPTARLILEFPESVGMTSAPPGETPSSIGEPTSSYRSAVLSPVSESELLVRTRRREAVKKMPSVSTGAPINSNIRKREVVPHNKAVLTVTKTDKENVSSYQADTFASTPIMQKMLHPSKKRALTVEKDDCKPSMMDTSYEFVDNARSSRSHSEQSIVSEEENACSLSVYAMSPYLTSGNAPSAHSSQLAMSPTIVKLSDQMNKLRGQNASIRSDLQKFRGMIQKVKKDINSNSITANL